MKRVLVCILVVVMVIATFTTVSPVLASISDVSSTEKQSVDLENIRIVLPDMYDAVVGDTFQLFYRGIVEAVNPYNYNIDVSYDGFNGHAYTRYFELTPTIGDIGIHTLTISVLSNNDTTLGIATTKISVANANRSPSSAKNVLCVGDSLTYAGTWVTEFNRRLTGIGGTPEGLGLDNINFIGTVTYGNTAREGYGGWSWTTYNGVNSPFYYNEVIDFQAYCADHGYVGIDYVYILLTWNGLAMSMSNNSSLKITNTVLQGKQFIDDLHEQYPNAKVKLMGIPLPSLIGGIGRDYTTGSLKLTYSNAYGLSQTVFELNRKYQEWCNEIEYSCFVEFINVSGQFDVENNMSAVSTSVNSRNTTTELLGTRSGGVHPGKNGYLQIGDAAFRNFASELSYTTKITFLSDSLCVLNENEGFVTNISSTYDLVEDMRRQIDCSNLRFVDVNENVMQECDKVGTGTKLQLLDKNGNVADEMSIVIYGDANGDGNIDSIDAASVVDYENNAVSWDPFSDKALYVATDVNGDGNVDSIDAGIMVDVENYILYIDQFTGRVK